MIQKHHSNIVSYIKTPLFWEKIAKLVIQAFINYSDSITINEKQFDIIAPST